MTSKVTLTLPYRGQDTKYLNIGCGPNKLDKPFINVDIADKHKPDVVLDIDRFPWPWQDQEIDAIYASHVFEHVEDFWGCVKECARILRTGGVLVVKVPDLSATWSMAVRSHKRVIGLVSFNGIVNGLDSVVTVPLKLMRMELTPYSPYNWMTWWCPWLLEFCAGHMVNFIHEQTFHFVKVEGDLN